MNDDLLAELAKRVDSLPRARVARLPTPLEDVPRFSAAIGDVRILIKREDMTGLAFGGNKTRELDFFIGDAAAKGADVFIAGGGVAQSNHAVQCAAAARRAGMTPVVVLHRFRADEPQGNLLLDLLMDADIRFADTQGIDSAIDQRTALLSLMKEAAAEYRARGRSPYVLASSFHPLGVVGYVDCLHEMVGQARATGIDIDHMYVTSAGATQVGLALGAKYLQCRFKAFGVSYTASGDGLAERMIALGRDGATRLGIDTVLAPDDLPNESFAGPGYGIPTSEGIKAIRLLARTEGMFVDPVYSGKGLSGLINHVRMGRIPPGNTVVFVHTGGLPALFSYNKEIIDSSARSDSCA